MSHIAVLVEFAAPASLLLERHRQSPLPIVGNGPPGTFVVFPQGLRVSLPTDQIVFAEDTDGCVRVGFGGMQLVGCADGHLVFVRVRELYPEHRLSPDRSDLMRLDARWVTAVVVEGAEIWRRTSSDQ